MQIDTFMYCKQKKVEKGKSIFIACAAVHQKVSKSKKNPSTHSTSIGNIELWQMVVCDIGYFPITIITHNISRYDIYHDIQTHHSVCVFTLMKLVALMYYKYNYGT